MKANTSGPLAILDELIESASTLPPTCVERVLDAAKAMRFTREIVIRQLAIAENTPDVAES